jgi:hypothetical protein
VVVPCGDDDSPARCDPLRLLVHDRTELVIERLVHFVEEHDVWVRVGSDRIPKACTHSL